VKSVRRDPDLMKALPRIPTQLHRSAADTVRLRSSTRGDLARGSDFANSAAAPKGRLRPHRVQRIRALRYHHKLILSVLIVFGILALIVLLAKDRDQLEIVSADQR